MTAQELIQQIQSLAPETKIVVRGYDKLNMLICFFVFLLSSCESEKYNFEAPTIDILEIKKINDTSGSINYQVNKGYGASIKEIYATFYDLTDTTRQVIKKNLQLKDSIRYTDSALVSDLTYKHDYRVVLTLKSVKNEYLSSSKTLSLASTYDETFTGIQGCDIYYSSDEEMYLEEQNGFLIKPYSKGRYLYVYIYFYDTFISTNRYEFKLNGAIPLTSYPSYTQYSNYVLWALDIPENLPAGVYTLNMYVNGKRFTSYTKLRIFQGNYSESAITKIPITLYPSWSSTEFILNDKIYYIYNYTMARFDLKTNNWEKLNSINSKENNVGVTSTQATFNYNSTQYLFAYYYGELNPAPGMLKLLKYSETADNWEIVTSIPIAESNVFCFRTGNCVYLGSKRSDNKMLWEYNLLEKTLTRKNDLPKEMSGFVTGACSNENTGFCITYFRELWQYLPASDSWKKLSTLYGGPYLRTTEDLDYYKGNVYVMGGYTYTTYGRQDLGDIWQYNIADNTWKYVYLCQYTYSTSAPKFIYKDKILMIPCSGYNTYFKAELTL